MSSPIQTLAELYLEVTRLLDGDDPEASDISTDTLGRLLAVAQRRIYREVRSRWNEVEFVSTVVTNNLAPLPDDFESAGIIHFGRKALIPVDEQVIQDYWSVGGTVEKYVAVAGSNLTFWPPIADGAEVQGRYYARLPDLTDTSIAGNALFQNADDLFVYATLVEAAPFFGKESMQATWESKYQSIVEPLNLHSKRAAYSAGRLMVRPSAAICGRG